ncbi:MAG: glycosyltransferase [Crocinitomicaceae bacterium]|nr:glycosyltransferase [Crocinitomicaceae bacterium]
MYKKSIIVSVSNDLSHDQRVAKVCNSLHLQGYEILLVGRKLKDSQNIQRDYKTHRIKLMFNRGALFYAEFNIRLFFYLLFKKTDVYHSNDLDTLLANWFLALFKRKKIVYDTHEYFTGVPEIQNRPIVKWSWTLIEKIIFPKLKTVFTVNNSIATLYENDYGNRPKVLRNLPTKHQIIKTKNRKDLNLPSNKIVVILQGAGINVDRGSEELVEAVYNSDNIFLCVVGSGDVIPILKKRIELDQSLSKKVMFINKLPYEEMMQYTLNSNVGVSLDKDTNINYKFSLPNKIFDYMKAGIPILATDLVEVSNVIAKYEVGLSIKDLEPDTIISGIEKLSKQQIEGVFANNFSKALFDLNWEKESEVLIESYKRLW